MSASSPIRDAIQTMLSERGDTRPLANDDSLFISGRLDSLAAAEMLMMLESRFGIDLADADFDVSQLDTIAEIEALVSQNA